MEQGLDFGYCSTKASPELYQQSLIDCWDILPNPHTRHLGNGLAILYAGRLDWHAMGKTGPEAYEGLRMLMPEHYPQPDDA